MNSKLLALVAGLEDGLEKAAASSPKTSAAQIPGMGERIAGGLRRGISAGARGIGFVGKEALKAGWPYALMAGIPLYYGAKAVSEGFGRGVSEDADKELSYRR